MCIHFSKGKLAKKLTFVGENSLPRNFYMDRRGIMSPITSEFFYSQLAWGTRAENFKVGPFGGGGATEVKICYCPFFVESGM